MTVPCGKGLYLGAPGAYPNRDPGGYARGLGCSYVIAPENVFSDQDLRSVGMPVWLFQTPEHWTPANWRETLARLANRSARLGLGGVVADVEKWVGFWDGVGRNAFVELGRRLGDVDAGFTSFPSWGQRGERARIAEAGQGRIWASPQLYARRGDPPAAIMRWRGWWAAESWSAMVPSVWPDPRGVDIGAGDPLVDRAGAATASYLRLFEGERGIAIWQTPHGRLRPGDPEYDAIRAARVRGCRSWLKWALGAGALGGLAYGGYELARRLDR